MHAQDFPHWTLCTLNFPNTYRTPRNTFIHTGIILFCPPWNLSVGLLLDPAVPNPPPPPTPSVTSALDSYRHHIEYVGKNCTPLKHEYDNCFNKWYTEKFLKGDTQPECEEIFERYRACVMGAVKEKKIDKMLAEAQKEISSP
ncbi:hypothetical protein BCR44DRAFT_154764, partial [Catenaria anguillulae PL171]